MSDQISPAASQALRKVWQRNWPDPIRPGQLAFAPSGDRIALGSSRNQDISGDSIGALTVYDASTGDITYQTLDKWIVGPIAFSPDSRQLLTAEERWREAGPIGPIGEERVRILDGHTFIELASHSIDFQNQFPVFSPDGRWLANDGHDLFVFDLKNGTERWRKGRNNTGVAWSPDSTSIAVGWSLDGSTAFAVLDALSGAERVVSHIPGRPDVLAYSPDGRWIVAGLAASTGCVTCVFDAENGVESWRVREADALFMRSIAISDDGQWIAAFSHARDGNAGILGVYDLARGTPRFPPVRIETGSAMDPSPVLYSPTLRHIVVQGSNGTFVIDARTGLEYARIGPDNACAALAPDGGMIAVGLKSNPFGFEGFVAKYDLKVEVSRYVPDAKTAAVAMSPAGTSLIAVADTSFAVTVLDAASGVRLARKPIPGTIASMVFADDGQAVTAGGSNGVRLFSIVGTRAWKVDDIGAVNALAAAGARGEWIATAAGRTVRLLSSVDGQSRWPSPTTHPHNVTRIAASADGRWIATGCVDRNTRILDAPTGAETFSIEGGGRVQALAFTPDGALLATANEDGTVILIDAAAAVEQRRVTRPFGCSRIAFSFDGTLLAAAWDDNTVSIFDVSSSSLPEVRRLTWTAPISGLAFNPVENTVSVATSGASVVTYDARDGIELVRILQPTPVSQFAFSADGALIATASDDGIVRVWASGLPPSD